MGFSCIIAYCWFPQGEGNDSDGGKKKKKKFRLELHEQQSTFVDSPDEVRYMCMCSEKTTNTWSSVHAMLISMCLCLCCVFEIVHSSQ